MSSTIFDRFIDTDNILQYSTTYGYNKPELLTIDNYDKTLTFLK